MITDDEKYVYGLIAEGEHQQQDFKFEITSARKIAKTLVAFANTNGGRLLIGVKDNGRVSGIRSEEEYYMIEAASSMYCKPEVPFNAVRRIVEGKTILEMTFEASSKKPHYAMDDDGRWLAYHRVSDNNYLADYVLLQVWKRKKRPVGTYIEYTENEEKVLQLLSDRGKMDLVSIRKAIPFNKRVVQNILVNLVSVGAVDLGYEEGEAWYSLP